MQLFGRQFGILPSQKYPNPLRYIGVSSEKNSARRQTNSRTDKDRDMPSVILYQIPIEFTCNEVSRLLGNQFQEQGYWINLPHDPWTKSMGVLFVEKLTLLTRITRLHDSLDIDCLSSTTKDVILFCLYSLLKRLLTLQYWHIDALVLPQGLRCRGLLSGDALDERVWHTMYLTNGFSA